MMRQDLSYQDLEELPAELVAKEGKCLEEIDLTHNKISDLRFLIDFPNLSSLILDHNVIKSHVKIASAPKLHTLWVNHNKISNLGVFITTVCKSCPNLRFLSMMNNEAAPSYFNGGTYQQYMDYRYYVISHLPKLEVLDDKKVEDSERSEAERIYGKIMYRENGMCSHEDGDDGEDDYKEKRCEKGWMQFLDKCYYIARSPGLTFDIAQTMCNAKGAKFVEVTTDYEIKFLTNYIDKSHYTWLGVRADENSSSYIRLLSFSSWKSGSPDESSPQKCVVTFDSQWELRRCNLPALYVCEMKAAQ